MAYGLRCWDSKGNLTLDVTDRITRIFGTFLVPKDLNRGAIQLDGSGDAIWFTQKKVTGTYNYLKFKRNGNFLEWERHFVRENDTTYDVYLTIGFY